MDSNSPEFLETLRKLAGDFALKGTHNMPYYKEKYGVQVEEWITRLHTTKMPMKIYAKDGMSVESTKRMFHQATRWLRDNREQGSTILHLIKYTRCNLYRDYIELHIRARGKGEPPPPTLTTSTTNWRDQIIDFVDDPNVPQGAKLVIGNIDLTPSDVEWATNFLYPLTNTYPHKIEPTCILVFKYTNQEFQ